MRTFWNTLVWKFQPWSECNSRHSPKRLKAWDSFGSLVLHGYSLRAAGEKVNYNEDITETIFRERQGTQDINSQSLERSTVIDNLQGSSTPWHWTFQKIVSDVSGTTSLEVFSLNPSDYFVNSEMFSYRTMMCLLYNFVSHDLRDENLERSLSLTFKGEVIDAVFYD